VLEDRALVVPAPDGPDREHRDRHGGRGRQAHAQREVGRGGAEDHAEERAEQQRAQRELGLDLARRDGGLEGR